MIEVGPFCLKSTEDPRDFCAGQIGIVLPPSTAVYYPVHVSSQISLLALVKYVKPGMTVLDIGTGTGVLAVAAEKLGASKVYATEIAPDALEFAPRMFKLNGCTKIELINGTFIDEEVDICMANIDDGWKWIRANRDRIKAKKVIGIDDKSTKAIVDHDIGVVAEETYDGMKELMPKHEISATIERLLKGELP